MNKIFYTIFVLLSILQNTCVLADSVTDVSPRQLTLNDYILTFVPLVIITLMCVGLIALIKKREKKPVTSGKNSKRIHFENKCTKYEKSTLFLKAYVIYLLPLQMILSGLMVTAYVRNEPGYSMPLIILFVIIELLRIFCIYHVRKNAILLNKKGFIFLIAYFSGTLIVNAIIQGLGLLVPGVIMIFLFYIYMRKRASLFESP